MPKVSVIVTCFNHEKFVEAALNSVHKQTFQDFEWIIIDDLSQDNTVTVIQNWLNKNNVRARVILHSINMGLCKSLNEALAIANGSYFAVISADDIWQTNKLEQHIRALELLPANIAVVYSDATHIDTNGTVLEPSHIKKMIPDTAPPTGDILSALLDKCFLPVISTTAKTCVLREMGGYDERLRVEDYDMWLRIAQRYHFHYSPGVVAAWRIVPTSMMHSEVMKHTPEASYTEFLISEKCLRIKTLTKGQRTRWKQVQADAAYWLYVARDRRAISCLWKVFNQKRNLKTLLQIVVVFCGIRKIWIVDTIRN